MWAYWHDARVALWRWEPRQRPPTPSHASPRRCIMPCGFHACAVPYPTSITFSSDPTCTTYHTYTTPPTSSCLHGLQTPVEDPENTNHAVLVVHQVDLRDHCAARVGDQPHLWLEDRAPCMRQSALVDVLVQLLGEPAFTVLRTQEQLGYVASAYLLVSPHWVVEEGGE